MDLSTDQDNFCRAVEAMRLDLLRSGKEARWLVAHPGLLALVWGEGLIGGQGEGAICGLKIVEMSSCPPGAFYVAYRRPDGA